MVTIKHVRDTKPGANTLNPLSLRKASSIVNDNAIALNAFNCHQLDKKKMEKMEGNPDKTCLVFFLKAAVKNPNLFVQTYGRRECNIHFAAGEQSMHNNEIC